MIFGVHPLVLIAINRVLRSREKQALWSQTTNYCTRQRSYYSSKINAERRCGHEQQLSAVKLLPVMLPLSAVVVVLRGHQNVNFERHTVSSMSRSTTRSTEPVAGRMPTKGRQTHVEIWTHLKHASPQACMRAASKRGVTARHTIAPIPVSLMPRVSYYHL